METNTEFTWMLIAFVLLMTFTGGGPVNGNPLVSSAGLVFAIPYGVEVAMSQAFPILAPLFILAFFYYFGLLRTSMGEGMQWFIVAAFLLMVIGL